MGFGAVLYPGLDDAGVDGVDGVGRVTIDGWTRSIHACHILCLLGELLGRLPVRDEMKKSVHCSASSN